MTDKRLCLKRTCGSACHFRSTIGYFRRCVASLGGQGHPARRTRGLLRGDGTSLHVLGNMRSISVVSDFIMSGSAFLGTCGVDRRSNGLFAFGRFFGARNGGPKAICRARVKGGVCCDRGNREKGLSVLSGGGLLSR